MSARMRGLKKGQGVIIPRANVVNLMLREPVVEAVREGKFAIYAVETVDEAIEILTGMKAGAARKRRAVPARHLQCARVGPADLVCAAAPVCARSASTAGGRSRRARPLTCIKDGAFLACELAANTWGTGHVLRQNSCAADRRHARRQCARKRLCGSQTVSCPCRRRCSCAPIRPRPCRSSAKASRGSWCRRSSTPPRRPPTRPPKRPRRR